MNREEIKNILPHREPMLLIDDVEKIGEEAVAHYTVRGDEFFLQGHFPSNPIVPGVILCEMLAQSACVLLLELAGEGKVPVYTGLDKVKFRGMVKPGDTVEIRSHLTKSRHPFYFAEGVVTVEGKKCVSAQFSFAVTDAQL